MEGPLGFLEIEAMLFGSANDGSQRDVLAIFLPQAVFDKAVVVGLHGDLFIVNDSLFYG